MVRHPPAGARAVAGSIEESEPKPQLDAVSTPGTAFGNTLPPRASGSTSACATMPACPR